MDNTVIGKRLKAMMNNKKMSIHDLAFYTNVCDDTVKKYLNGEKIPTTSFLIDAATMLGVTLNYLSGMEDSEELYNFSKKIDGGKGLKVLYEELSMRLDGPIDIGLILHFGKLEYSSNGAIFAFGFDENQNPQILSLSIDDGGLDFSSDDIHSTTIELSRNCTKYIIKGKSNWTSEIIFDRYF